MNPILQGLQEGYGEEEILSFLSKAIPQLGNTIKKATKSGYKTSQILGFLSKNFDNESLKGKSESQIHAVNRRADAERTKYGLKAATTAVVAPLAASAARSALSRALPTNLTNGLSQTLANSVPNASPSNLQSPSGSENLNVDMQQQPQLPNQSQALSQKPPFNQTANNVSQVANTVQSEVISNPKEYLEKLGVLDRVKSLLKTGNTPESTAVALGIKRSGEAKIDQELLKNIEEYAKLPKEKENIFEKQPISEIQEKISHKSVDSPQERLDKLIAFDEPIYDKHFGKGFYKNTLLKMSEKEREKWLNENADKFTQEDLKKFGDFYKNWNPEDTIENLQKQINEKKRPVEQPEVQENIVATPNGFGEVKISRNGKSIVEVEGKKHSVEDSKILKPPKEAAIEAMELIKSFTPEEMRSTHHMLNSYDEEEKKGYFVFHNGESYVVDDISPEEYEELSKEVSEAKTSGETIIGKWAKGHGSRGAGYNKVVKGHRDRKVVPELVKKFRKLKVGYNLLSEWQRLLNEK